MYLEYWQLAGQPFQNLADPGAYYESPLHEEALARLFFVIEQQQGCGLLCGPPGTGKSLLLRVLERQSRRAQRRIARIDLLGVDGDEMLWRILAALQLDPLDTDSTMRQWRLLQDHLTGLAHVRLPVALLFDHLERAGGGCFAALERLLQIRAQLGGGVTTVVAARSPLPRARFARLQSLADLRMDLDALTMTECPRYIRARLLGAGAERALFTDGACRLLQQTSGGVPRELNRLCELCLLAAMGDQQEVVDERTVAAVAQELPTLTGRATGANAVRAARANA